jgi:murein DD-endopeptidase MepM/ murein hydrolase activator NlpD
MTKRTAHPSGVDISGPRNSPVLATAPGKVVFAGRNGAYGTMVTIDHGEGFKTRYGHLKKALVKKGDVIDFRTKIGVMGSTGRSTGRHVHYEVMYDGKHHDPVNFFKAGKYAFKVTPKIQEAAVEN